MVAIKTVSLLAVVSSASAQLQVNWGQCGGINWTGPTACSTGFACSSQNSWFFQCLATPKPTSVATTLRTSASKTPVITTKATTTKAPSTAISTTATKTSNAPVVTALPWGACSKTTVCTSGYICLQISDVASQCVTKPTATAAPWAQCAGQGFNIGPLACPEGLICKYNNIYNSQCLRDPNAPAVSTTASTTSAATPTPTPKAAYKYLFTFGDSYSQTGFDLAGTKPAVGNQLGNPALPGWTTSGGLNWIGNLLTSNPQLLGYNLASGGATTDAALVTPFAPTVLSFVDQVAKFRANLVPAPAYAPWKAADSLFGIWIGVNDVGNAWWKPEWPTLSQQIINKYFEQVQLLYNAGARNFVFLSVPPIERAPSNLLAADPGNLKAIKEAVLHYNALLTTARTAFVAANPGVFAPLVNVLPGFNTVLDNPTAYGAANSTCYAADGTSCLWWNDYHPGLVLQKGAARDVAIITGLSL